MAGGIVSPFLLIQNPRLKSGVLLYTADSIKIALRNGNCALGIYCLVVTQANYSFVVYAQMSNAQSPMTICQSILY